jgi:hypothetical protein
MILGAVGGEESDFAKALDRYADAGSVEIMKRNSFKTVVGIGQENKSLMLEVGQMMVGDLDKPIA